MTHMEFDNFLKRVYDAAGIDSQTDLARVLHLEQVLEERNRELVYANLELKKSQDTLHRDLEAEPVGERAVADRGDRANGHRHREVETVRECSAPGSLLLNERHEDGRNGEEGEADEREQCDLQPAICRNEEE